MFQASDEKIPIEMNLIGEADIKVDSEEFCEANDVQENYDGNGWIIWLGIDTFNITVYLTVNKNWLIMLTVFIYSW